METREQRQRRHDKDPKAFYKAQENKDLYLNINDIIDGSNFQTHDELYERSHSPTGINNIITDEDYDLMSAFSMRSIKLLKESQNLFKQGRYAEAANFKKLAFELEENNLHEKRKANADIAWAKFKSTADEIMSIEQWANDYSPEGNIWERFFHYKEHPNISCGFVVIFHENSAKIEQAYAA